MFKCGLTANINHFHVEKSEFAKTQLRDKFLVIVLELERPYFFRFSTDSTFLFLNFLLLKCLEIP